MKSFALGSLCAALVAANASPIAAATRGDQAEKPIRTISIAINGEALATDTPPQSVNGRILVPLRDVFEALGIAVTRTGNSIAAKLPTGSVVIAVNSRSAVVNGTAVVLDAPVTDIDGTLYVPLKLLVAAFGARASYDQRSARVEVVSSYIGRTSGAEQQRSGGGTDVQGVVAAIDANSQPPSLTVVRGGTSRTISVTSEAKIWSEDVTIHSQLRGVLGDVRVGDAVHAILAKDGRVVSIFDYYKSTSGTVAAAAPSAIVLESGRVVTPGKTTEIALNSAPAKLDEIRVGDYVTVRSNPESGELRQIVASRTLAAVTTHATPAPGTPSPTEIADVTLSTTRPLRTGESFDVVMHGTPGGRATFEIGDLLANLPMRETQPGTYSAHYIVPDRFNVKQIPVYGRLSVGTTAAPRTQAAQTLSAASTPPAIGEIAPPAGQRVNNARPSIFATYATPTEIAINASSVVLEVNGHDVTSAATRTASFITYSPGVDLPNGLVTVTVKVADAAGNTSTRTWTFTIAR
ncbi:MAG: hypothetical protein NVS3B16_16120 [Vulcanimicrobiaceae bacterium]